MTTRTTRSFPRGRELYPSQSPQHKHEGRFKRVKVLHDLPPEMLLLVFDFLPDGDLYCLAFCCRFLHHLALPAYLSRYGSSPNSGEFIFDNIMSVEALKALNSALYRPRLNRLVYTYDLGQMLVSSWRPSLGTLPRASMDPLAILRRFLDLVDVDDVHLQLGDLALKSRAEDHLSARVGQFDDQDDRLMLAIQRLGKSWLGILNEFLFKAKCRHLTVELVSHQRSATLEIIEDAIIRNYYGPNSLFILGHEYMRQAIEVPSRWLGLRVPRIEKFAVHSEALFHPLLIQWTIRTLNLSTLSSVAFDQLHHLTPYTWSLLLPCITIPNLVHFSINLCAIYTKDLYNFFARHPTIQELHLGANLPSPDSKEAMPKGALPALRMLAGPPDYLVALLSSPMHPLSTIETVYVWYRARRASQFTLNAINHDLAPVCLRLRSVKEVVLSVSFETSGVDWNAADVQRSGGGGGDSSFSGNAIYSTSGTTEQLFPGESPRVDETSLPLVSFISSCVTKLEYNTNVYILPLSIIYFLPKWLRVFSKVRELSVRTLAKGPEGKTTDCPFELHSHKVAFLHGIGRNCPFVKKVEVDGKEEEVPTVRVLGRLP